MNVKFQGKNLSFQLDTEADQSVYEEIFVDRDYKILDEHLKKAGKIVDIGAHIGLFAVYAAVMNDGAEIYSFETDERNFALLKNHLKENRIRNVKAKNVAVGAKDGVREFFISEDSHNHSFFVEGESKKVNVLGAKKMMDRVGHCDVLKIDCEGAEFEIIGEMGSELSAFADTVYIEYHLFDSEMNFDSMKQQMKSLYKRVEVFPSRYDKRMGLLFATNHI